MGPSRSFSGSPPGVFGDLPTAGPPPSLADWRAFEDYMDTLLRAGTIRSIKEVWWDVRPHPDFGTVEIRMLAIIAVGGQLADVVDALVTEFAQDRFVTPEAVRAGS
jgi:glutamate---cysteine ligase / carboxylate-amine ligase